MTGIVERERRCARDSRRRPETSCSSRTPTSSTTRSEYPKLLAPILDGKADVVYRLALLGGKSTAVLYFWHSVGNKFLTTLSNMFTNLNLTDMETCYKVFRREVLQKIRDRGGPVRLRAGDHREGRATRLPDLRGRDLLLRPHLRGGEEDRLEGRRARRLVHPEIPLTG